MSYYKILTNRFAEWKYGDIAAMDDAAAETPLKNGEIALYVEKPVKKTAKKVVKKPVKKALKPKKK
jgi:mannose-1-phosphate guanylyltransferase